MPKKEIHPQYFEKTIACSTCKHEFTSGTTFAGKEIRVDTCSNCHPFFTGKKAYDNVRGRVERFRNIMNKKEAIEKQQVTRSSHIKQNVSKKKQKISTTHTFNTAAQALKKQN